jgi:hypothetical protein
MQLEEKYDLLLLLSPSSVHTVSRLRMSGDIPPLPPHRGKLHLI